MKLKDVGELKLIDFIASKVKTNDVIGIGDDCAVIAAGRDEFLISMDNLVEDIHFFKGADPYLLGRKSLSVNLSDIAAMAGEPLYAFLGLSLPAKLDYLWFEAFVEGFLSIANRYGVLLLGGDTTAAEKIFISVTVVGKNPKGESVLRKGAKAGDCVFVSGPIGCSMAGLEVIKKGLEGYDELKKAHLDPEPKINEASLLKGIASAMIDVSDGLLIDLKRIAKASNVKIVVDFDLIPFCATDILTKQEMLFGGEDYQLLFTADCRFKGKLVKEGFYYIGRVEEGEGVVVEGLKENIKNNGYEHFRV